MHQMTVGNRAKTHHLCKQTAKLLSACFHFHCPWNAWDDQGKTKSQFELQTWHFDSAQTPGKTHLVCWDVVPCWQWHWRQIQIQLIEALQLKKLAQLSLLFAKWYLETSKGKKEKDIFPFFKRNNFGETSVQTSAKWRLATAQPPSSLCRRLARLTERSTAGV